MISDISYLILNYNPQDESEAASVLEATIDALYVRKSKKLKADIFLLDQGSIPRHQRRLQELQAKYSFSLMLSNRNLGISGAINWFVRTCKSPVIGLITSDVLITEGMDEDLFHKAQIDEVFQVTPFTDKSDLPYQVWIPAEPFGAGRVDMAALRKEQASLWDKLTGRAAKPYLRVLASELNVMFWRRDIFDKVGYFDERWQACYENNDFSLRCFLAGGCTAVSLDSFVWHYHKMTEKSKARETCYKDYIEENWPEEIRRRWDEKWPALDTLIKMYEPLKEKTINDYPKLLKKFAHQIHLPYEQDRIYQQENKV
ncbi:MAG: glycosyltransferase [Smithellaceae bacterium]